jgi:Glycosyltransferase family 87
VAVLAGRLDAAPGRARLAAAAAIALGIFVLVAVGNSSTGPTAHVTFGFDAHAYWAAWRHGVYSAAPNQVDAFLYSPAFAQALWLPDKLPWPVFVTLWMIATGAVFAWLLKPLGWRRGGALFVLCVPAICMGNVWAFIALATVLGMRRPGVLAVPLLTKLTPAVGILWFAARREWRPAAIALGVGLGVAAVSFAVDPHLWTTWVHLLARPEDFRNPSRAQAGTGSIVPLAPRLVAAVALTVWAARANRPRWLPLATLLATPTLGILSLSMLTAIPRMAPTASPVVEVR